MTNQPATAEQPNRQRNFAVGNTVLVTVPYAYESMLSWGTSVLLPAFIQATITEISTDLASGGRMFTLSPAGYPAHQAELSARCVIPLAPPTLSDLESPLADAYAFDPIRHALYTAIAGSRGYGMQTPTSDYDVRLIYQLPPEAYFSLSTPPAHLNTKEAFSTVTMESECWEVRHFLQNTLKGNPAMLEVLYLPFWSGSKLGRELRQQRSCLLSKQVYLTFGKYAESQFERLQRDRQEGRPIKPKMAMHLLRLLLQGAALLRGEDMMLPITERKQQLLAVKQGETPWENILALRERFITELRAAYATTLLPDSPDIQYAEDFLQRCRRENLQQSS